MAIGKRTSEISDKSNEKKRVKNWEKNYTTLSRLCVLLLYYDTIRYDTRNYSNVQSKADMTHLSLLHGTNN